MMSTLSPKPADEFDAARTLYETLKAFPREEQQRLLRWAQEKLGLAESTAPPQNPATPNRQQPPASVSHVQGNATTDIKSFMEAKSPKSDNQFAAAVAYFYKFDAPDGQKKDAITKEDITSAVRLVHRKRPSSPAQVLVNAHHQGLLDKTERGQYRINSVGENLVAMVLPGQDGSKRMAKKPKKTTKKAKRSGK